MLTLAGYSINDTVVVFDRVRENLRKYKTMPLRDLLDLSVNQTLSRTIMTSATTLLAVLALYFFGGEVLRGFSVAMIWGIVVGTYSSIFVAAALLLYMKLRRAPRQHRGGRPRAALAVMADLEGTPRSSAGRQLIESYGGGGFKIAGVRHAGSVLVFPDQTMAWPVTSAADISAATSASRCCSGRRRAPHSGRRLRRAPSRRGPGAGSRSCARPASASNGWTPAPPAGPSTCCCWKTAKSRRR